MLLRLREVYKNILKLLCYGSYKCDANSSQQLLESEIFVKFGLFIAIGTL